MARKSRKAKELEKEILSSVPAAQRKMITQPLTFTYLNGEMTMTQTRIQTMIMERLQERIAKAIKKRSDDGYIGELFSDADFKPLPGEKTTYLTFEVKYSELGVTPANYKDVDEAAKAMQRIVYEKDTVDENGRPVKDNTVVFAKVTIPKKDGPDRSIKARNEPIRLRMLPEVARDLFNLDTSGYHRYLKDAVFLFSGSYTGRIYLLINANKDLGMWVCPYEKLRKILLTSYDENTRKVAVDKYRDISDFKKRVLEPARREIAEAADRVDCTFDYEMIYPAGKRRGTPDAIAFHIQLTDLGRNINKARLESQEASELRKVLVALHLTVAEANRLMKEASKQIPDNAYARLTAKAKDLALRYAKDKMKAQKEIENYHAYTLKSLQDFITQQSFTPAEEVTEAKPAVEEWE